VAPQNKPLSNKIALKPPNKAGFRVKFVFKISTRILYVGVTYFVTPLVAVLNRCDIEYVSI